VNKRRDTSTVARTDQKHGNLGSEGKRGNQFFVAKKTGAKVNKNEKEAGEKEEVRT